ncbi:hypothetical protein B0T22DRAFT_304567 [Podospora appendiculata]|uniref:Fe2OG dioxygenase domain-containing protein n=1 Tax=Podospora appendiculata TaxID=314037 RepID=A0AAE1C7E7_9PEZI|nr:hypothetical protein B0T22DRAFT_304567 [Podospora appendiculata]
MAAKQTPAPVTDRANPKIQRWEDLGLTLIHHFLSESEEATMVAAFHAADPRTGGKKRLSQHFGYHFDYTTFGASDTHFTPLPAYIAALLPRLPIQTNLPDQFTVQYYPPGSGIPPHVDTHSMFDEELYSVSFGSSVPMVFKKCGSNDARKMRLPKRSLLSSETEITACQTHTPVPGANGSPMASPSTESTNQSSQDGAPEEDLSSWEVLLPSRSLLLMTGPSRYGYTHGIKSRRTDVIDGQTVQREGRYSITMRTTRRGDKIGCNCSYPGVCDARVREELERDAARSQ